MHDASSVSFAPVARTRRRLGAVAILSALLAAACGLPTGDDQLESPVATLERAGESATPFMHAASADTYRLAIEVAIAGKGTRDGQVHDVPDLPLIRYAVVVGPVTEERSGALKVKLLLESASAAPARASAEMIAAAEPLARLEGHAILAKSGGLVRLKLSPPGHASGTTLQLYSLFQDALERLFVPVPAEAIGRGGAFAVSGERSVNEIPVVRKNAYQVVDHADGRLDLGFDERDSLARANAEVVPRGVPVELPIIVESLVGAGQGTVRLEAGAATAVGLEFTLETATALRVPQGGGEMKVATKTVATYRVTRAP